MPTFPPALKAMFVTPKTVEINVVIDETGKVQKAEPLPRKGSVPDLMVRAAIDSARLWTFKPAQRGIQPISSEMVLRFQFKPTQ
jgi:TonB family protein